jgi:hypothetical protein
MLLATVADGNSMNLNIPKNRPNLWEEAPNISDNGASSAITILAES